MVEDRAGLEHGLSRVNMTWLKWRSSVAKPLWVVQFLLLLTGFKPATPNRTLSDFNLVEKFDSCLQRMARTPRCRRDHGDMRPRKQSPSVLVVMGAIACTTTVAVHFHYCKLLKAMR